MAVADLFIEGQWLTGEAAPITDQDPATSEVFWQGNSASAKQVAGAVRAARSALPAWSALSFDQRAAYLKQFQQALTQHRDDLTSVISHSVGKPLWEANTEVGAMINKIDISLNAYHERTGQHETTLADCQAFTRHKPHGVLAVLGPFNFPGHLANGHIVPALLAGNTVVLKQSELAPSVAVKILQCWEQAGLPDGVINLLQGDGQVAQQLLEQPLDGVLFTGSFATGQKILRQFVDRPDVMVALEMGGNNPLIVHDVADVVAAAYCIIQSTFITAGQRCTCARRLILTENSPADLVECLLAMTQAIKVGHYTATPEPFMGPVITAQAAEKVLQAQTAWQSAGATTLLAAASLQQGLLSPGIIDVTALTTREDKEVFGPLLQVIHVKDLEEAISVSNQTRYGLAAGILSDDPNAYQTVWQLSRAGIVNWNRPLTGAASQSPFGGVGRSGNHHPSAYYAADYCAYPVASLETPNCSLPTTLSPGITVEDPS